ncbi:MAG TPA: methyltransferase domain-containing protein, partial [Vicinamibacterales bacterium]
PWAVLSEADFGAGPMKTRLTADADPARVSHNIGVAIDAERQLFNGQPATIGSWIDALELAPGARVLHIGCGLGYYTALMAHCAGPGGRILAFEADSSLAESARRNLASMPWVDVRADATSPLDGDTFDAILVNAGVTHPLEAWLDALAPGGRLILPMTSTMVPMGTIGKGLVFLVTKDAEGALAARVSGVVAIFSAVGLRDDFLNASLGKAMMTGPQQWQAVTRLRRDPHDPGLSCWLHGPSFCLSK